MDTIFRLYLEEGRAEDTKAAASEVMFCFGLGCYKGDILQNNLCLFLGGEGSSGQEKYWVPKKLPKICTVILCFCIGKVA